MLFQSNINRYEHEDDIQQVAVPSWLSNLDPRVFRISTSALSILTAKAIYIHGYHHPLRLLLLHLVATSLWEIILRLSSRKIDRKFDTKDYTLYELARQGKLWSRTGLKLCLRFGFGTAALFCEYQAIYRFRSLPALAMLLLPDWSLLVRLARRTDILASKKIVASFGYLVGVAMVLVFEEQLSEVGLKLLVITVFLGVASQLLRQEPSAVDDDQLTRSSLPIAPVRDKILLLLCTIIAAMIAIYLREWLVYTPPLSNMLLFTLAVNTLAAVVAFQCSGSYFKHTEPLATFNGVEEDYDENEMDSALETVALQCVLVLGSFLVDFSSGSPFSVSIWQYIGFWIALGTPVWAGRQLKPCVMVDTVHTSFSVVQYCRLPDFETPDLPERQRCIKWSGILQAIFAVSCMLLSISPLVFSQSRSHPSPHWIPRDQFSTPSNTTCTLDFVVSRYNEPAAQVARQINTIHSLPNINSLSTRLIVYSTGLDAIETYERQLQDSLHPSIDVSFFERENTGREAATYLTHMLSPPFPLASHTFFLQAEMHSPSLVIPRIRDYFVPNTGFLSLSSTHQTSDTCAPRPWDHSTWSESPSILSPIFSALNVTQCTDYAFTYRGQFIVSAQRILATSPAVYSLLLEDLIDANATTHQEEYKNQPWLPTKQDSLNAPLFGFTMERLWGLVFGCQGKMEGCPSLVAGAIGERFGRRGGDVGSCQCLDAF